MVIARETAGTAPGCLGGDAANPSTAPAPN